MFTAFLRLRAVWTASEMGPEDAEGRGPRGKTYLFLRAKAMRFCLTIYLDFSRA